MDRFKWSQGQLNKPNEESVYEQNSVTVYNLDTRTTFTTGRLQLTSHRLIWHSPADPSCKIELDLSSIVGADLKQAHKTDHASRFDRTYFTRLVVSLDPGFNAFDHLSIIDKSLTRSSTNPFVQFEFEFGGHNEFSTELNQQLLRRHWLNTTAPTSTTNLGIRGIERTIQSRLDNQDHKITASFKDLSVLMNQAKEMVNLSNTITAKLAKKEQASADTDTEDMKKLKGYFSSMGIIDCPVTKQGSGAKYFRDLAGEISRNLTGVIVRQGGVMTLSEVFCRLNRARSIAGLVSAEDLLNACRELNGLGGGEQRLRYSVYREVNLHVLEVVGGGERLEEICGLVEAGGGGGMSAHGLSRALECSLIVARKHLLDGEMVGRLCRDETGTDLKFYKNLF